MILFLIYLLIITIEGNSTDILVLKFKTYYPPTNNIYNNETEYNSNDFINSFLFSNLYLEFESYTQIGINQTLNTIIKAKTDSFILRNIPKNNINICNFKTTLSKTFKLNIISSSYCRSEEIFQIYTDISMTKHINANFTFDNYFCLNDSICGEIGTDISTYQNKKNFILALNNILNTGFQYYSFHFTSKNKNEGIFVFGEMPHNYFVNIYNENDIISFYSYNYNYEISLDSITFDGKEYYSEDKKDDGFYDYISIAISPDSEGIEFDNFYFDLLIKIFFNDYIQRNICIIEKVELMTNIIYCYGDKFGKNDINKFPKIVFSKYKLNFNITFESDELFYYKDNKYFFKIYNKIGGYKKFILGRIFLKKYLTVFNPDEKKIYFYNKKIEKNVEQIFWVKYQKLIIILFIVGLIIFLFIGILIGKFIFKERKKHANELDEKYEYQGNKNNVDEPLYNSKEDDEK